MKMLIASGLACVFSVAEADTGYEFRAVDFPGAANTIIFAVNNLGHFVGAEKDIAGAHHAIFDDGLQLRLLDPSGVIGTSGESRAFSINNRDDIAGAYTDASGAHHGYVHHADGSITQIDFPLAIDTQAYGVNDLGTVIGVYTDVQGNTLSFVLHKGHYRNIDLPGGTPSFGTTPLSINDFGEIVGQFTRTEGTPGFGYLQKPDGRFTLTTGYLRVN